jgi:hypothetical protein
MLPRVTVTYGRSGCVDSSNTLSCGRAEALHLPWRSDTISVSLATALRLEEEGICGENYCLILFTFFVLKKFFCTENVENILKSRQYYQDSLSSHTLCSYHPASKTKSDHNQFCFIFCQPLPASTVVFENKFHIFKIHLFQCMVLHLKSSRKIKPNQAK